MMCDYPSYIASLMRRTARVSAVMGGVMALMLLDGRGVAVAVPRMVFAHYMVCCSQNGPKPAPGPVQAEIRTAIQAGLDGFALNVGAWSKEPRYIESTQRLFDAAAAVSPNFKMFFSFDNLDIVDSVRAMQMFGNRPNYLKVDGRSVVSSFGGTKEWAEGMRAQLRQQGMEIYLIPYFYYPLADAASHFDREGRDVYAMRRSFADLPSLDGYFYFGAARDMTEYPKTFRAMTALAKSLDKTSMMGIAPYYKGFGPNNARVFENNGFESMRSQWIAAIEGGADWVELVTWNDWGESTYLAPFGGPRDRDVLNYHWGPLLSHEGFLRASRYYIDWFRSGKKPAIRVDSVFYFYRLHPKTAEATINLRNGEIGQPTGAARLNDRIFFTAFLTAPATLLVTVGGVRATVSLKAGISNVSVPMRLGSIIVTMRRGDVTIKSKRLEFPIVADGRSGNFNYFSGSLL